MTTSVYEQHVKEVMSRDVVTIDLGESVHEALQLMAENKVAALPVVNRQGRCVGVISTSDLVEITRDLEAGLDELEHTDELLFGHYLEKLGDGIGHQLVQDVMTESVASTLPDAVIPDAARLMLRERIHRLPVVDDQNHLVGILSTTDILSAFVNSAPVPS